MSYFSNNPRAKKNYAAVQKESGIHCGVDLEKPIRSRKGGREENSKLDTETGRKCAKQQKNEARSAGHRMDGWRAWGGIRVPANRQGSARCKRGPEYNKRPRVWFHQKGGR